MDGIVDCDTACTSIGNFTALSRENKLFAGTDCLL